MAEPFIAEIIMFGGNFAPRTWALCDGQLLNVSQNDALFSLLGTIYGGDGRTTFGLPDLRGRVPIHAGSGPGLSPRRLGAKGGSESNVLNQSTMPAHNHTGSTTVTMTPRGGGAAITEDPNGNVFGNSGTSFGGTTTLYATTANAALTKHAVAVNTTLAAAGGSQPVPNMAPVQVVNFIIAQFGTYPSRH